jgi:hypothetical protein
MSWAVCADVGHASDAHGDKHKDPFLGFPPSTIVCLLISLGEEGGLWCGVVSRTPINNGILPLLSFEQRD